MRPEKIAICFGDNDFYCTFIGLLRTLEARFDESAEYSRDIKDKETLYKVINELTYPMYLLYQNPFSYNEEGKGLVCERTKSYLTIDPSQLLIDDEVDAYLSTLEDDWDNGETFIFDNTKHLDNRIYSI